MCMDKTKVIPVFIAGLLCLSGSICTAQHAKKAFTIADEIGVKHFGDPYTGHAETVRLSPDGNYFAVDTERGRLDLNRVEDSLRFYRSQEVKNFLEHFEVSRPPLPVWVVNRYEAEGPVINDWRWLADSTGVAFLERTAGGKRQLVVADLRKQLIETLTSDMETIDTFDIGDREHYVYTVRDTAEQKKRNAERQGP